MGFVRLFGVVGQVLVKPNLLRDVNEEFHAFNLEEATVRRKLANANINIGKDGLEFCIIVKIIWVFFLAELKSVTTIDYAPSKLCTGLEDLYQIRPTGKGANGHESVKLFERLRELEAERKSLGEVTSEPTIE